VIIGIDISQLAYENTGVANFISELVENLVKHDSRNQYVLFYSSLRKNFKFQISNFKSKPNVKIKTFKFPPTLLDLLWNKLHLAPIEWFIGDVDVFITSDWTQPPTKRAKKVTIIYDFIAYKYPHETHDVTEFDLRKLIIYPNIVEVQKRCHKWIKKECDKVFCISESTKKDAVDILGLDPNKIKVLYPGVSS